MRSKSFYAGRVLLCAIFLGALLCGTALADVEWSDSEYVTSQTGKTGSAGTFSDVPEGAAYAEAVEKLAKAGIITGDENGKFNPDNTITRAETAAIMCRLMGVEDEAKALTKSSFSDVSAAHWAVGYIAKAAEMEIINGYGDGNFGPEDKVTYEQVVKMLVCFLGNEDLAKASGGYPDGYLAVAKTAGITGDMTFTASGNAPRHAVAQLIVNALS